MFIRYANNFLAGHGHAWNGDGVQTYGSTSLLHFFVVLALKAALPLSDSAILVLASWSMGLASVLVLVILCGRFTRHSFLRRNYLFWAAVLCPLLLAYGARIYEYHSGTGMDTTLALLTNCLVVLCTMLVIDRPSAGRVAVLVAAGYAAFLARPDSGVYVFLFPVLAIALLGRGHPRKVAAGFAVAMAAVILVDGLVKWRVFGGPLPLSFYAKQGGLYKGYAGKGQWNPVRYLGQFFTMVLPFVIVMILVIRRSSLRLLISFLAPVAVTFCYFFSVTQIMGFNARLYFPALPFVVVAGVLIVDECLLTRGGSVSADRWLVVRVLLAVLAISSGPGIAAVSWRYQARLAKADSAAAVPAIDVEADKPLPSLGWWQSILEMAEIAKAAPEGTVIALSEYGYIGACAPHVTLIDLVGLHDNQIARAGFSAESLLDRRPDLIWGPHPHYSAIVSDLLSSGRFWQEYDYYPGAFEWGLAIRKTGRRRPELTGLVEARWRSQYPGLEMGRYRGRRPTNRR